MENCSMEQRKPKPMLRLRAVKQIIPYSTSTIYDRISKGTFPKPVPIGPRAVAWIEDEILAFQEKLIADRHTHRAG
jgi:prophage regulatory protein